MELNADVAAIELLGDNADGPGTKEGIEYEIPGPSRRLDTRLNQFGRKRGEMSPWASLRMDIPNGPAIAAIEFEHSLTVVVVALRFGEHEKVFMRSGRPVLHAFRLCIRLVPNDVRAQIPTVILQRKRQSPRNAKQIFRFQTLGRVGPNVHRPGRVLLVRSTPTAISTRVAVPDVKPKNPVVFEYALSFGKHRTEAVDKLCQRRLVPDLVFNVVIAEPPIGWRSHKT